MKTINAIRISKNWMSCMRKRLREHKFDLAAIRGKNEEQPEVRLRLRLRLRLLFGLVIMVLE